MVLPPKNLSIPFEPSLHSPDQPLLSSFIPHSLRGGCDFNPGCTGARITGVSRYEAPVSVNSQGDGF